MIKNILFLQSASKVELFSWFWRPWMHFYVYFGFSLGHISFNNDHTMPFSKWPQWRDLSNEFLMDIVRLTREINPTPGRVFGAGHQAARVESTPHTFILLVVIESPPTCTEIISRGFPIWWWNSHVKICKILSLAPSRPWPSPTFLPKT